MSFVGTSTANSRLLNIANIREQNSVKRTATGTSLRNTNTSRCCSGPPITMSVTMLVIISTYSAFWSASQLILLSALRKRRSGP